MFRSILASTRLPATRTWHGELPLLMAVQEREACGSEVSTKKKKGGRHIVVGSTEKEGHGGSNVPLPWPLWRGQRCGAPHASKVCPFLFPISVGVSPFLFAFSFLWPPHCERFSLLPLPRRDGCTQGDAAHDLFPLICILSLLC